MDLLNHMNDIRNAYKLVLNVTYHSNFSNLKDTVSLLHLLRTPDQEDQNVFHEVPIIGFLKSVKFESPLVKKKEGFCAPCKKSRCEICEHIVSTDSLK